MSKNHVLAIVAATLLGAFWVYPNVERGRAPVRAPQSVTIPTPTNPPAEQTIQRKRTHIKPMKVKKTATAKPSPKRALKYAKRIRRINFERADRRPTSLPSKKYRLKKDNLAANQP